MTEAEADRLAPGSRIFLSCYHVGCKPYVAEAKFLGRSERTQRIARDVFRLYEREGREETRAKSMHLSEYDARLCVEELISGAIDRARRTLRHWRQESDDKIRRSMAGGAK